MTSKKLIQFVLAAALGFGWALGASAQNECRAGTPFPSAVPIPGTNGTDIFGANHQNQCLDPVTGRIFFPGTLLETINGPLSPKTLANIRVAAQYPGPDWCSKATAADADLGATSGEIWVDTSAGTSLCVNPPTLSSNHVLRFINGNVYNTPCWTITNQSNFAIAGLPGKLTTIQFSGTCTSGLTIDGSALGNLSNGVKIVDITFSGNGNITNTVTLKGVARSYFDFSARNSSGVAVNMIGSLINTGRIVVSVNEGAFTNQPTGGVLLDQFTVPSTVKSNSNDIYYIVEGVNGNGVEVKQGNENIIRGILEGNVRGVQIDATVNTTTVLNVDMESNSTEDVLVNGNYTQLVNSQCLSTVRVHAGASSSFIWNFGNVDPTVGCLFTTQDAGTAGLIIPNVAFGSVLASYALINRSPVTSSPGSFFSNNTANRFWSLPDDALNLTGTKCVVSQKNETGADATLLSCTPLAQVGTYRVCISMAVSAQNTATLGWTATWTDSNGSAQAPTNLALSQSGVAAPALTFTAATNGNYFACQNVDINNAATAIVAKTTFAGTSIAYKASATIERIQ